MATVSTTSTFDNVGELLHKLGDIPPERVRMSPLPGTATEQDVIASAAAPRKRLCELIDGVLVEKGMGFTESILASFFIEVLNSFVRSQNLGLVASSDGMVRLWPGRVRIPGVGFCSWDRLPGRERPQEPIPQIAPDLAIEVLSTSNTSKEMLLTRRDYFSAGTKLVWEVDPRQRTVTVYANAEQVDQVLDDSDVLTGGQVLPGFELPLSDLFAELDRKG